MLFKRFFSMFFFVALLAGTTASYTKFFSPLKNFFANNLRTVRLEDPFGGIEEFPAQKKPEPTLVPREIVTYLPIRNLSPEGWIETEWFEKRKTILAHPDEIFVMPTPKTNRFSNRQHNNLRQQYLREAIFEIQHYKKPEIDPWDFEKKVRVNITEEVNNTIINELEQNGTPIADAQPNDIGNLIQISKQREDVQQYIKSFNQEFKENDLYTKMMECLQQKDQTQCKAENKKFIDVIAANLFKTYYGYNPKKSSSANQMKMGRNYLFKRIPIEIGFAAMCASDPDNLRKLEKELQYEL